VAFLYKSFAQSFFVLEVKVKLFIGAKKMVQLCSKNVGEIDFRLYRCQENIPLFVSQNKRLIIYFFRNYVQEAIL
jgi:hypothetical protein